jgi:hypothetical protein
LEYRYIIIIIIIIIIIRMSHVTCLSFPVLPLNQQ